MGSAFESKEPDFERLLHGARIMALRALHDRDCAEDIALEARAKVFTAWRLGQILQPELIGAYLCTVVRNLIADELRDKGRVASLDTETENRASVDVAVGALDALVRAEETDRMQCEIARLEPREQRLVRQFYHEGLNCAEIATLEGLDPARVRKQLERVRKKLRARLSGPLIEPARRRTPLEKEQRRVAGAPSWRTE